MFSDALRINYTGRRRIKNHNIILRYALTRHPRPRVTGTAARRFRTRRARAPDTHVPANDKRVTPFVGRLCPEYLYQARWLKLHLHDEPRASSREISTRGTLNPIVPKNSVYPPRPGRGLEEIKIEDAWSGTNARRVAPGVGFFALIRVGSGKWFVNLGTQWRRRAVCSFYGHRRADVFREHSSFAGRSSGRVAYPPSRDLRWSSLVLATTISRSSCWWNLCDSESEN